jgi:uncharacterized protein (DUF58 family)
VLTRRGKVVLVLAFVLLVAGRILGVTELFGLAAAAVVVVAVGVTRARAPRLRVTLSGQVAPPVIAAGDLAALEVAIENSGTVPTPAGRLQLVPAGGADGPLIEVPRLVPGERASVSLRLPTERRGRHEVTGFDAVLVDALGTARRRITGLGPTRFGVRPVVEALSATLPAGGGGAELETTRSSADRLRSGASLLRPYVPGDDLRRVHWPTTARIGDIMVREGGDRERQATSGITVLLSASILGSGDQGVEGERFEHAVCITASLLTAAAREGTFRLVIPGAVDSGDGTGARHLDAALEALTDVRASPVGRAKPHPPAVQRSAVEERVVIVVVATASESALPVLLGGELEAFVPVSSPVVVICAGAPESSLEATSRRRLVVRSAVGDSLEELWTAGEAALARA